ncbi:MAG: polysaccharide pyruvyl transferase family protein [Lachnospiraceae bacterium]|nr:polysaccharide pyruvyl transferase family protein [Lachnospiraceae bacterium]
MDKRINKLIKIIVGRPDIFFLKAQIKTKGERRAVLIGSPVHSNLGDHLIADNCINFIQKLGFQTVVDIPEFYYDLFGKTIKLRQTDIIFIVGGGWLGNDYEDSNIICQIIRQWPRNKIVIFPQTIHFSAQGKYNDADEIGEILHSFKNVLLCVREKKSYVTAIEVLKLPCDRVLLSPDITLFSSVYLNKNDAKHGVILSIRNDRESINKNLNFTIKKILEELKLEHTESSTVIKNKIVPLALRSKIIHDKLEEYGQSNLVITNRLHSMIFAMLSRTKCMAFDNSTHKVSETISNWLSDNPNIHYVTTSDYLNLRDEISMIINTNYIDYSFSNKQVFEELANRIGEFINAK